MAHWLKFFVALAFCSVGLACFALSPSWWSFGVFILLFIVGSALSQRLFDRYATLEQKKEDLEARLIDL
jgi:membrane protein implicated in regulation of membrane protease activity